MKGHIWRLSLGLLLAAVFVRPLVAAIYLNLSTLQAVRAVFRTETPEARTTDLLAATHLAERSSNWDGSYQAALAAGRNRLWLGDWSQAESALQAALAREPEGLLARIFLARVYQDTDRWPAALDLWVAVHGADYFRVRQDYATAATVYERELAAGAFEARDYLNLAEVYGALGRWAAARDVYLLAIGHYPTLVDLYENLAQVDFWKLDDLNGAVAAAQSAINLTAPPYRYNQYLNLGDMYRLKGQPAMAEVWYDAAIRVDAARKDAHIGLAYILIDSGRIAQAEHELALALRADPADPVAQQLMAKIHSQ